MAAQSQPVLQNPTGRIMNAARIWITAIAVSLAYLWLAAYLSN
jgi:hypothetical protein